MSYSQKVLDHYENPRNVGTLDKDDKSVGTGMVGAPACGDVMKLQIKVNDDGVIEDAKFKTYGCGSAIASSSELVEMLIGMTLEEAKEIKNKEEENMRYSMKKAISVAILSNREDIAFALCNQIMTKKDDLLYHFIFFIQ